MNKSNALNTNLWSSNSHVFILIMILNLLRIHIYKIPQIPCIKHSISTIECTLIKSYLLTLLTHMTSIHIDKDFYIFNLQKLLCLFLPVQCNFFIIFIFYNDIQMNYTYQEKLVINILQVLFDHTDIRITMPVFTFSARHFRYAHY